MRRSKISRKKTTEMLEYGKVKLKYNEKENLTTFKRKNKTQRPESIKKYFPRCAEAEPGWTLESSTVCLFWSVTMETKKHQHRQIKTLRSRSVLNFQKPVID